MHPKCIPILYIYIYIRLVLQHKGYIVYNYVKLDVQQAWSFPLLRNPSQIIHKWFFPVPLNASMPFCDQ